MSSSDEPSNKGMKQTSVEHIGRSQLIPGVLRTAAERATEDGHVLKYIELKRGYSDNGPAWIARVKLSKSGRTVYFADKALKRAIRGGSSGNHIDLATGKEYWVSGVKRRGLNRHWAGSGVVRIEAAAVPEYLKLTGAAELDSSRFEIIPDLEEPNPIRFADLEHRKLHE